MPASSVFSSFNLWTDINKIFEGHSFFIVASVVEWVLASRFPLLLSLIISFHVAVFQCWCADFVWERCSSFNASFPISKVINALEVCMQVYFFLDSLWRKEINLKSFCWFSEWPFEKIEFDSHHPVLGVLVFLPRNFLDFLISCQDLGN